MREILFRGKRKDNGVWVEGSYAIVKDYLSKEEVHVIVPLDCDLFPCSEFSEYYEIIPETLVQYTGLKDCISEKIFEGDIVHNGYGDPGVVKWLHGSFVIHFVNGDDWDVCQYIKEEYTEIIGNIHDNPELLEVK